MLRCDVVIVGGGIGGGALATALAGDGFEVVVLEATEVYEDHVRGESMLPWGVAEARRLGVEQVLLDAGAEVCAAWIHYDKDLPLEMSLANPLPVGMIVPGVGGSMNIRHPDACNALATSAAAAGATYLRGIRDVVVTPGPEPTVECVNSRGEALGFSCRLVVGADGRNSAVRRQTGLKLERKPETHMMAGLLVDKVGDIPDHDFLATEDDLFMASFQQPDGKLRIYLCPGLAERHRFSGPGGLAEFRRSARFGCLPFGEDLGESPPAGPLATYPGDDSWIPEPYVDGVVLIGDAAGFNDPIIGQGLSITMRDARSVRDVVRAGDVTPGAFREWSVERMERMRRLRQGADFMSATFAEDCDDRPARRARFFELQQSEPMMFGMLAALFGGPENAPPEVFDGSLVARMRGTDTASVSAGSPASSQ